jgi:2-haloacid dehalogenase
MGHRVAIFDAYGTLLDVHSAMQRHAGRIGERWARISADWRQKHLEYTWVRSMAGGERPDFWALARESLEVVAQLHGLADRALLDDILSAYRTLDAYPEVPDVLRRLRDAGIARAILSNGEPTMLADAVRAAGIDGLLDDVLSVESAGVYKPDPRVYRLATDRFGVAAHEAAFVSSNAWDAYGASVFGFRVFRVNRSGAPDEYGLAQRADMVSDLALLPEKLSRADR